MVMNTEFLFQIGAVIASLSGAWALVRSQVSSLKANQAEIKTYVDELNRELDTAENAVSVLRSQIRVMTDILSPDNLKRQHEWQGEVTQKLNYLKKIYLPYNTCTTAFIPILKRLVQKIRLKNSRTVQVDNTPATLPPEYKVSSCVFDYQAHKGLWLF
jgi:polyhydroxyalkanoate synthesis regulator phasin